MRDGKKEGKNDESSNIGVCCIFPGFRPNVRDFVRKMDEILDEKEEGHPDLRGKKP